MLQINSIFPKYFTLSRPHKLCTHNYCCVIPNRWTWKKMKSRRRMSKMKIFGFSFCFFHRKNRWNIKWNVYVTRLESLTRDMFQVTERLTEPIQNYISLTEVQIEITCTHLWLCRMSASHHRIAIKYGKYCRFIHSETMCNFDDIH